MISIKLTDSIPVINDKIKDSIAKHLNTTITKNKSKLESRCRSLATSWIMSQPEIKSLMSQETYSLYALFGLNINPQNAVSKISEAVSGSVSVEFNKINSKLSGGLKIYFQPSSFANLLSISEGFVKYGKGTLHWLRWLLEAGDSIIVADYSYKAETGKGRSGYGYMISGGFFRVPPEFSGTLDDNFVTRALIGKPQEDQILNIIRAVFQ